MLKEIKLNLKATHQAFNYQLDAFNAIKDKEYFGIFHEQGLGKTKIGIDLALHWIKNKECDGVVFVTKKSLIKNWEDEIRIHTSIHPLVFSAQKKENTSKFFSYGKIFICHFKFYFQLKSSELLPTILQYCNNSSFLQQIYELQHQYNQSKPILRFLNPQFDKVFPQSA